MRPMRQMRLMLQLLHHCLRESYISNRQKLLERKGGLQDRHETVDLLKGQGHQGRVLKGLLPNWTLRREAFTPKHFEADRF